MRKFEIYINGAMVAIMNANGDDVDFEIYDIDLWNEYQDDENNEFIYDEPDLIVIRNNKLNKEYIVKIIEVAA